MRKGSERKNAEMSEEVKEKTERKNKEKERESVMNAIR